MRLQVSKSIASAGKCAKENCELPFKKGTLMVGIQHANEQVHWRHLDCIEPVEVKVLGPPNDSDDFAQLKEDVQSKFSEWHSGALDILDQNSQDSEDEFPKPDGNLEEQPARKMAKETNDDDAENPTENSQYGGKVVRVIKSSNSFASAIGSMLGLGFGQSDVPNPTEKAKDSDSNASEEDVQDSVSEPERDDSFEIGSAKTEYEQDVQEDDSISVQSSSSVEDAKEGDSVGMSSDSEKSVQESKKRSTRSKKSVVQVKQDSVASKPVTVRHARKANTSTSRSDDFDSSVKENSADDDDDEFPSRETKKLPATPMVRSSRSKAVGKTGSKSNSTATSARKPRATQAQVHESDDDDALEQSQVLKKQTKSAPKPKASAKKPASRPKTINSNAVSFNLSVEYAKSGKSSCVSKGCTDPTIQKGSVRVAVSKKWHHVGCLGPDQIKSCSAQSVAGFDNLNEGDQAELEEIFDILNERRSIVATPPPSEDDQVLQAKKVAPAKKTKNVEAKAPKVTERARRTRQVR